MSYRVLALKWRPQQFSDVAGQDHVSRTLSNALESGRAAHAYLFTGPRGVGKTTASRILAKALNCESGPTPTPCGACSACVEITRGNALDVIEIDGASNRGIDDIRDLREGVRYAPAHLRYKVYIIDEVHMLTTEAFNALLKTLEEPPDHVVFILATTEVLKVPQTVLSRCQRFDFARLRNADATGRLRFICDEEGIKAETDALSLIALKGEGSMRDALTLLDQVLATGQQPLTTDLVREVLGILGRELFFTWSEAVSNGDASAALSALGHAADEGGNLQEMAEEFLVHLRNLLLVSTDPKLIEQVEGTEEDRESYIRQASDLSTADLLRFCRVQIEVITQMKRSGFPRVHQEVALAEMCALPRALELRKFIEAARQRFPDVESGSSGPTTSDSKQKVPAPKVDSASPSPVDGRRPADAQSSPAEIRVGGGPAEPAQPIESEHVVEPAGLALHGVDAAAPAPGPAERAVSTATATPNESDRSTLPVLTLSESAAESSPDPQDAGSTDGNWDRVLEGIATAKPAIQGFLQGSYVVENDEKILRVGIPGGQSIFLDMLEGRENKRIVVGLVQEHYGRPLGVRFESVEARVEKRRPAASKSTGADEAGIERIVGFFDGDVLGPS